MRLIVIYRSMPAWLVGGRRSMYYPNLSLYYYDIQVRIKNPLQSSGIQQTLNGSPFNSQTSTLLTSKPL
ncbi:hypothetical protein QTP88_019497 [Uroleucon formosanum]